MNAVFDGADARADFRKSVEQMLRNGRPDPALVLVRRKLSQLSGESDPMVAAALETQAGDITLVGWDDLAERFAWLDKAGKPITALGIDFSWPGHVGAEPDAEGHLAPYIETNYYADIPEMAFSSADRETLLRGYLAGGSEWQGCFEDIDNLIEVEGMSPLYGAVTANASNRNRDGAEGDAYLLSSCASAVLLHLAVRDAIRAKGLPRAMAVLVGSNEDFPFFDAPVVSVDESAGHVVEPPPMAEVEAPAPTPAPPSEPEAEPATPAQKQAPQDAGDSKAAEPVPTGADLRRRIAQPEPSPTPSKEEKPRRGGLLGFLFR
ncbi:hypothetical protein [Alteraurantiacibacter aquimixticola]|uniref:Uncharacterized protein n=1 Tax=Alteraurantiacibacter aquimixticola TaxID=2489173 RepID=A0A4T3F3Z4_9SPHN|nr:hypothetical protein [Alteraurantiacibacter aquimixticola]TIX51973.1 hypothetical protein E5222_05950 [Alteraurantiacibacter aquimixticola]